MPLVFVHGVNVRKDAEYDASEKQRDGLFRRLAFAGIVPDPDKIGIENPYWGQYAARFAWNHASLPEEKAEQFGAGADVFEEIVGDISPDAGGAADHVLVDIARESLVKAVDCLWAAAAHTNTGTDVSDALTATALKALRYAEAVPNPDWLQKATDDEKFVEELLDALDKWTPPDAPTATGDAGAAEHFGGSSVWDHMMQAVSKLQTAATNLKDAATDAASGVAAKVSGKFYRVAVGAVRPWAHQRFSLFLGDIFVYLDSRGDIGSEGAIVKEVGGAFRRAHKIKQETGDKLIIVAHSMGGNIAYDILSHFMTDVECDLLLTVGSQVGLFEELKRFRASDSKLPSGAQKLVPRRANIRHWINVYDPVDVLGYATGRIFEGSKDVVFPTGTNPLSAHSMYFYRPSFHERLRARLVEAGIHQEL